MNANEQKLWGMLNMILDNPSNKIIKQHHMEALMLLSEVYAEGDISQREPEDENDDGGEIRACTKCGWQGVEGLCSRGKSCPRCKSDTIVVTIEF